MTDLSKVIREETYKLLEKAAITEKSPPGWSGTTKAMKKHKDIDNPWALAHWMKNKGAKPHYKPENTNIVEGGPRKQTYTCCGQKFLSKASRDAHKLTAHPKDKPENKSSTNEQKLFQIIKEEFDGLVKEAQKNENKIIEKLETMRKNLIKDNLLVVNERGSARNDVGSRPERRIPLETVAKVIDIPVNELILHFLNGHRVKEGHANLCEYRLGCVYFYGKQTKEGIVEGKNVFDKHQRKIAKDTLKMPDPMVGVMGGPDKETAKDILKRKPKKEDTEPTPSVAAKLAKKRWPKESPESKRKRQDIARKNKEREQHRTNPQTGKPNWVKAEAAAQPERDANGRIIDRDPWPKERFTTCSKCGQKFRTGQQYLDHYYQKHHQTYAP